MWDYILELIYNYRYNIHINVTDTFVLEEVIECVWRGEKQYEYLWSHLNSQEDKLIGEEKFSLQIKREIVWYYQEYRIMKLEYT